MQRSITNFFLLTVFAIFSASLAQSFDAKEPEKNAANSDEEYFLYAAMIAESEGMQDEEGEGGILSNKAIRIINLGPIINFDGLDYAPTISVDGRTLYYVSNREGSKLNDDDDPSHDFWAAKKENRLDTLFFQPYNIDLTDDLGLQGVNTSLNEGAASIAADGQSLYFTGCSRPDGLGDCDLYRTTIEGERWGRPVNLGRNVNSAEFDSQPSIAPDQSRIYFVSTRPGPNSDGKGKLENMDIWYSDWDDDMEEWLPAKNLEVINTPGADVSPFIAADNATLFFASDGLEPNYGGLDFYLTTFDYATDTWSKPQNVGAPINTEGDEQFITLPASGDIIYFSSSRDDLPGYQGSYDIFMAFVPSFFRTILLTGTVVDECSGEYIPSNITIKNPITGNVVTDSLTLEKTEFQYIITNQDFGDPLDSLKFIDLEITGFNPKYGSTVKIERILKPAKTEDANEAGTTADELFVKLTLGQRPVLDTEIDEADYIRRTKESTPELASFRGLVMEQVQTWDLYPLLNYVFFPIGSAELPRRYILFDSPADTQFFTDTTVAGGTLDKYYHLLNIYGYRMKKYPDAELTIVGTNDGETAPEKNTPNLSKNRAELVYNYLKDIWQISPDRMKLEHRNKPRHPSSIRVDTTGNQENRRVELISDNWEIMKPVFDKDPKVFPQPETMDFVLKNGIEDAIVKDRRIEVKRGEEMWKVINDVGLTDKMKNWNWTDEAGKYPKNQAPYVAQLIVTTNSGAECKSDPIEIPVLQITTEKKRVQRTADSTLERYSLILFPFDSYAAGKLNERIMEDYVYERCKKTSVIEVIGHTDVVGLFEHNEKLSKRRAGTVQKGIERKTRGNYGKLKVEGVGEEDPLYTNELPEGRFYNRTVQVIIRTPVSEYDDK